MLKLRLLALLLLVGVAAPAFAVEPPAKKDFYMFLLVGQSNMAGRGKVEEQDREENPRILMFTKQGSWEPAVDPLHFDKSIAGVGIGRSFAQEVLKDHPEIVVGLIPCAVGGSPIASWEPGAFYKQTNSHPWDDALRRAKAALPSGELKGILWHQGESDSRPGACEVYEKKLHALIARFRKELDAPDVPFLAGQMGVFEESPWSDAKKQVDAAHQSLPKKVAHTGFVSAEGLGHKGDKVHFNSAAYRELGRRYADAWKKMTAEP